MATKQNRVKPKRPKNSPLHAQANGQWARKIDGHRVYFGSWKDHDGAFRRYHASQAALNAGEDPYDAMDNECGCNTTIAPP